MRPRRFALVLVLLLAALPASTADSHEVRIQDPAGDVRFNVLGEPSELPLPSPAGDHLDIRSAWVANETADTLEFGMQLQRWPLPAPAQVPWQRLIRFQFAIGEQLVAAFIPSVDCAPDEARLQYARTFGYVPGAMHTCHKFTVDPASATLRFVVPKGDLFDHRYVPLQVGHSITDFRVEVTGSLTGTDRAPNNVPGPDFVSRVGAGEQSGDLFLSAEQPIRASNGESTTMVFQAVVRNSGSAERVAVVTTHNDYPEWTVRTPSRVRVAAQDATAFPVILTMNFTHEHGANRFFHVRVEDPNDPTHFSSARLGVRWLAIPQPAGHHDRLWLYAVPHPGEFVVVPLAELGLVDAWMNALSPATSGQAQDTGIPPSGSGSYSLGSAAWEIYLRPELAIGLDFDAQRPASFEARLRTFLPATRATLNATVAYCDLTRTLPGPQYSPFCLGARQVDLLWGQVDLGGLPANSERPFTIPLRLNRSNDELPYQPGGRLALILRLLADVPQDFLVTSGRLEPLLLPRDALLQLPLLEYHDPLDQAFEDIGSLRLVPLDPHAKPVNPGRTAAFRFDLWNAAPKPQSVRLLVEGVNAEWATMHGSGQILLGPDEKRMVALLVEAPATAAPGERAELFLVAESEEDPSVVALARLRATVVDPNTLAVTDEASLMEGPSDPQRTPGAPILLALAAALVIAVGKGRRPLHK